MLRLIGFLCVLLFCRGLGYTQSCDGDGCADLSVGMLRAELAAWRFDGRDCNGDGGNDLLDAVCMINQTPGLGAPVLDPIGDRLTSVGEVLTFTLHAEDPNGDAVVYGAEQLPDGAVLDPGTGAFSFAPVAGQGGPHVLRFSADDGFHRIVASVVVTVRDPTLCPAVPTRLTSSPAHGDRGVAVTRETILRFSRPLAPGQDGGPEVVAVTAGGIAPEARRALSGDRKTLTLFYDPPLPESTRVCLTVNGDVLVDYLGCAVDADGDGAAGGTHLAEFDTLTLAVVAGTSVCGRVFASELLAAGGGSWVNQPLEGVVITVDGLEDTLFAVTDALGDFRLDPAPAGEFFVHIDGRTATASVPGGAYYPFVGKSWTSIPGGETVIGDVFLPLVAADTLVNVSETRTTDIGFPPSVLDDFPELDGARISVPPDSLYSNDGTRGGRVGIAPVDPDRLPGTLPEGLDFPLVVTVQTDGATNFDTPAPICLPNLPDPVTGDVLPPGASSALWSFNHDIGRWEVVGAMTVSADGTLVCSDPGVGIRAPGWHAVRPGTTGGGAPPAGDAPEEPEKGGDSPPPAGHDGKGRDPSNPGGPPDPDTGGNPCDTSEGGNGGGSKGNNPGGGTGNGAGGNDPVDPVYLFSGEYYEEVEDLRIPGRGVDFVWSRKYRSKIGPHTAMGHGWDFSYNIFLDIGPRTIAVCDGNSRRDVYTPVPGKPDTWARAEFFRELCRNEDGTYTMMFANQGLWTFFGEAHPAAGKLAASTDRNGNTLTFAYDGNGRLDTITDTLGRDITVAYNADGYIASVTDFTGRAVRYSYYDGSTPGGGAGDLATVTTPAVTGTPHGNDFPDGKTTTYTYSTGFGDDRLNHNLLTITDPKGQTWLTNIYAAATDPADFEFDKVLRQVWGDAGDIVDLVYVPLIPDAANGGAVRKTIINDRVGNVEEYFWDLGNRCVLHRAFTGRANPDLATTQNANRPTGKLRPDDPAYFETRYFWNADGLKTREIHPAGNITEYVYEGDLNPTAPARARANLRTVRRLPGAHQPAGDQAEITQHYTYVDDFGCGGCGFNFVASYTDGRGHTTSYTYDARGNRTGVQGPLAEVLHTYAYNAFGQMTEHIYPDHGTGTPRRDTYAYFTEGPRTGYRRAHVVDADGLALTTTYDVDAVGNLVGRTDPRGNETRMVRNALNQVVRETSPEVSPGSGIRYTTDYFFDANDNTVRREIADLDADGNPSPQGVLTTTWTYETLNNPLTVTEDVGPDHTRTTAYAYDANRNRILIVSGEAENGNQPANTEETAYDERDLPWRKIRAPGDPDQATEAYDVDARGLVTAVHRGLEAGTPRTVRTTYDGYDRPVAQTDAMGNTTELHYDAADNLVRQRRLGERLDQVGSAANVVLYDAQVTYDALNRPTRTAVAHTDAAGAPVGDGVAETLRTYAPASQLETATDDHGHRDTFAYDGAHRLVAVIDAAGNRRDMAFDGADNLIEILETDRDDLGGPDQQFRTTFAFDGLNRRIAQTDSRNHTTTYAYDSRDNLTASVDALGNRRTYAYDGLNRLVETRIALTDDGTGTGTVVGTIVLGQTWDDADRLTARTDANGHATTYVYDALDRHIATVFADGTQKTMAYDVFDTVVETVDAAGTRVTLTYDAADRLSAKTVDVGPGVSDDTSFETFAYDGLSRLVRAEDDDSLVTRAYDSLSHVIADTQNGRTVTEVFDAEGNRTACGYPGGRQVTTTYDALDRPVEIRDAGGLIAAYAYVGTDRVARRDLGNGTRLTYAYDGSLGTPQPAGDEGVKQVVGTTHTRIGDAAVLGDRTYTWDAVGNKTARTDQVAGVAQAYRYDSAYRLVGSTRTEPGMPDEVIAYTLDGVHNRLAVSGGPHAGSYGQDAADPPADAQMNQYTTTPMDARTYDELGNLTAVDAGAADVRTYGYDYRNRLVAFSHAAAGVTATYAYDVLGRRIARTVDDGTPQTTEYVYSDWQVLEEIRDGTVTTHVYGLYIDEILNRRTAGSDLYYHQDDLANVNIVSDSLGSIITTIDYDAFGVFDPSTSLLSFMFGGRRFDPELQLYHFRSRYYDPEIGQFATVDFFQNWGDTLSFGSGKVYVGHSPQVYVDPYGYGKVKLFVKLLGKGGKKQVSRKGAKKALKEGRDVYAEGSGGSKVAKKIAREKYGKKAVRHDAHKEGWKPHYQHKNGKQGHVYYSVPFAGLGVEVFGDNAFGQTVDFFNPATDIEDLINLLNDDGEEYLGECYE